MSERLRFKCKCCGLCCRRDPYYAVSILDIERISEGLSMSPLEFFSRFCGVVLTPAGFRYSVIFAPDGCPFLRDSLCGIHAFKPIGCRVFPESSMLPVKDLKRVVSAIDSCAIMELPDSELPLATDYGLMGERDAHFEHTKAYFAVHEDFDEPSWAVAVNELKSALNQ